MHLQKRCAVERMVVETCIPLTHVIEEPLLTCNRTVTREAGVSWQVRLVPKVAANTAACETHRSIPGPLTWLDAFQEPMEQLFVWYSASGRTSKCRNGHQKVGMLDSDLSG